MIRNNKEEETNGRFQGRLQAMKVEIRRHVDL